MSLLIMEHMSAPSSNKNGKGVVHKRTQKNDHRPVMTSKINK